MKYVLKHKNISVADIKLDEAIGYITEIYEQYNTKHLPVGVDIRHSAIDCDSLNKWWINRSIPAGRTGIISALEALNFSNTKALLAHCLGLSLSDQYWIKPHNIDITWCEINFFDNPFSEDMGNVLFGKAIKTYDLDLSSPDNTTDGCLKKRWKIINGERYLIKGGSNPFMQQPLNEAIASKIMERLNINHIPYYVIWDEDNPYSICKDFITADTELVSAYRVMMTQKKDDSISAYTHYVNCCKELGVKNIVHSLDEMLVLDYIIANKDRHFNNFGLIRNANSTEWIGAAPIFDSGSSLCFDTLTSKITTSLNIKCKPFCSNHDEQIKLVSDFDWIDFKCLNDIEDDITEILCQAEDYIDTDRRKAIIGLIKGRINNLERLATARTKQTAFKVRNTAPNPIPETQLDNTDEPQL